MHETDGGTTHSHVLCWSAEAEAWETHVAQAATRLSAAQPYRSAERLQRANEAWRAWTETECEYWGWEEGGGLGEQVDRVRCPARVTADRAITLIVAAAPP